LKTAGFPSLPSQKCLLLFLVLALFYFILHESAERSERACSENLRWNIPDWKGQNEPLHAEEDQIGHGGNAEKCIRPPLREDPDVNLERIPKQHHVVIQKLHPVHLFLLETK